MMIRYYDLYVNMLDRCERQRQRNAHIKTEKDIIYRSLVKENIKANFFIYAHYVK